eukprot:726808-Hanusia_phi.AAC.2
MDASTSHRLLTLALSPSPPPALLVLTTMTFNGCWSTCFSGTRYILHPTPYLLRDAEERFSGGGVVTLGFLTPLFLNERGGDLNGGGGGEKRVRTRAMALR